MVDASLKVTILILVTLLQTLQMVQFGHEVAHLVLECGDFAVTLSQLLLFSL